MPARSVLYLLRRSAMRPISHVYLTKMRLVKMMRKSTQACILAEWDLIWGINKQAYASSQVL